MPAIDVFNKDKKKVGTLELRDDVFAVQINVPLVHQVLKAQQAAKRQGTAKTKTKGEVRGGGKKPFRQKGTGNARQGSSRSPLQPGGGQTFGPVPRSYRQDTPKEMIRGALRSALSDRFKANRILVLEDLEMKSSKTKDLNEIKKKLGVDQVLVVDEPNRELYLSGRNLRGVKILETSGLNVYDIIRNQWLVMSKRSVQSIESRLASA